MAAPKGNKYAIGAYSGRPKKFSSPEEMQKAIDNYFEVCDTRAKKVYDKKSESIVDITIPIPYTIEGLCETLDIDRATLLDYEKLDSHKDFHNTVKKAKLKVQKNLVERGLEGNNNPAVSIFVMKNNFGYRDKSEQEITGKNGGPIESSTSEHRVIFENYQE